LSPQGMGAGQPHGFKEGQRRQGRHDAARRLYRTPEGRLQGRRGLWRDRDRGAPPPPLRGGHQVPREAGDLRPDLLRDVARRKAPRDRRMEGPPLVHRRPVPPRTEVETLRAASAFRGFRPGGEGGGAAGLTTLPLSTGPTDFEAVGNLSYFYFLGGQIR